jgi:hypothetical protein
MKFEISILNNVNWEFEFQKFQKWNYIGSGSKNMFHCKNKRWAIETEAEVE